MVRVYRGPTRVESWPINGDTRLAVKVVVNQSLYRVGGVWRVGENLDFEDGTVPDRLYLGGYELNLSDEQLDELEAAGLGQFVVTV